MSLFYHLVKYKPESRPITAASNLDAAFAALADPTRRAIVARLARGEATVLELAEPFAISLPAISKHLKVLERAALITRSREAQRRPCRLRAEALREVSEWAEHTRRAWEQRFDRLDDYLHAMQAQQQAQRPDTSDHRGIKQRNPRGRSKR